MKANQWRPVATQAELSDSVEAAGRDCLMVSRVSLSVNNQRFAGTGYALIACEGRGSAAHGIAVKAAKILALAKGDPVVHVAGTVLDPFECVILDGRAYSKRVLTMAESIFGTLTYRVQTISEHGNATRPMVGHLGVHPCLIVAPHRNPFRQVMRWEEVIQ